MDTKYKNKALFIVDIALLNENTFVYDEYMVSALTEFIKEYYFEYPDEFNTVFEVSEKDKKVNIELFTDYEEYNEVVEFLYGIQDSVSLKKLLDDVGNEESLKIGKLANLFYIYLNKFDKMMDASYTRIKQ